MEKIEFTFARKRGVWIDVDAELESPGPYSIFFVRGDGPDYQTTYDHWITWNGFVINFEPIRGYQEIRKAIYEFDLCLRIGVFGD